MRIEIDLGRAAEWFAGLIPANKGLVVYCGLTVLSLIVVRVLWAFKWTRHAFLDDDASTAFVWVIFGPVALAVLVIGVPLWIAFWVISVGMFPPPWRAFR